MLFRSAISAGYLDSTVANRTVLASRSCPSGRVDVTIANLAANLDITGAISNRIVATLEERGRRSIQGIPRRNAVWDRSIQTSAANCAAAPNKCTNRSCAQRVPALAYSAMVSTLLASTNEGPVRVGWPPPMTLALSS